MKGTEKICLFVSASNERQSSGDTGTIVEYTNVTHPNQSGLSRDRPPWTHNTVMHTSGGTVCVYSMIGPYYPCRTPKIVGVDTIWV